jgi:hypothetical protein
MLRSHASISIRSFGAVTLSVSIVGALLLGCGGAAEVSLSGDAGVGKTASPDSGSASPPTTDASSSLPASDSSAPPPAQDSGLTPPPDDGGAATRNAACTQSSAQTGTLVNTAHGRLDGTLVYVLPTDGSGRCYGDSSHVHLQIEVDGLVYDVAVDIGSAGDGVGMYEKTLALPGGAWAEGWHGTDELSYPTYELTSAEMPIVDPATIASNVEALLVNTSKISVFCTGYSTDNGCHDVHYVNGDGNDGAIVLNPTDPTPTLLFFRFVAQTF